MKDFEFFETPRKSFVCAMSYGLSARLSMSRAALSSPSESENTNR